jgi:hypothetical protein
VDTSNYGEDMLIYSKADPTTDTSNKHTIEIIGPAQYYLQNKISFTIKIDSDPIYFYDPSPTQTDWKTENTVTAEIFVTDNSTSGVDKDSVEFQFSINNGKQWSGWYKPEIEAEGDVFRCFDTIDFSEGIKNIVQWRGKDKVGNEYTYSNYYRINIDGSQIEFRDPIPRSGELVYTDEPLCSITLFDSISGVNASSVQYSMKLDETLNWSSWRYLKYSTDNKSITVSKKIKFRYGEFNYIKWRAMDIAGNGYFISKEYQLNITHKIPKVYLTSPENNKLVNFTLPTFKWADSYLMIQPVSYLLNYWLDGDPGNKTQVLLEETEYTILKPLLFGETYNWEVIPETIDEKGVCDSGVWNLTINTQANIQPWFEFDVTSISGDAFKLTREDSKTIEIVIYNKGNHYDNYRFELFADPLWNDTVEFEKIVNVQANSTKIVFMNLSIPSGLKNGIYKINLRVSSTRSSMINKSLNKLLSIDIKVADKTEELITVEMIQWATVLIVIIVVILIVIFVLISRAKYKKFEDEFMHGTTPVVKDTKSEKVRVAKAEVEFKPEHKKVIDRTSDRVSSPKTKEK